MYSDDNQQPTEEGNQRIDESQQPLDGSHQPVGEDKPPVEESQPPRYYKPVADREPLSVLQYILMFIIMAIPILNIIMLFVWSFGISTNLNKRNYARANLIIILIVIILMIIFGLSAMRMTRSFIHEMPGVRMNGFL